MECQRLQRLLKNWYLQVQGEAMAPARMVAFMENHLQECEICLADPKVREETERIKVMVLPAVKAGKAVADPEDSAADGFDESEDEEEEEEQDADDDEI